MTFWNEDKIEWLRRCIKNGLSSGVTGEQIGCSRNAAIGKANRLGLRFSSMAGHPGVRQKKKVYAPRVIIEQVFPYKEATVVPEVELSPLNLTIWQLNNSPIISECRFITAESPAVTYCGLPVVEDTSWCRCCTKIVYPAKRAA